MADWTDKDILADFIANYYGYAHGEISQAQSAWSNASNAMYVQWDYELGQQYMLTCLSEIIQCLNMLLCFDSQKDPKYGIAYFLKHHAGLNMQNIIDTMWESNKLESFHFINYIDAMRGSIWNISIYEEHLHEWYRHFLE